MGEPIILNDLMINFLSAHIQDHPSDLSAHKGQSRVMSSPPVGKL